jgi:hypothetical protein
MGVPGSSNGDVLHNWAQLSIPRAQFAHEQGAINATLPEGDKISPAECLVFEDSVPGVEAGRRAGMRVIWVPHPHLKAHSAGREGEVLAGRTGVVPIGKEGQLGEVGDGWAEEIGSLKEFDCAKGGDWYPELKFAPEATWLMKEHAPRQVQGARLVLFSTHAAIHDTGAKPFERDCPSLAGLCSYASFDLWFCSGA